MNKYLLMIVILLVPITIVTSHDDSETIMATTLENTKLEVPSKINDAQVSDVTSEADADNEIRKEESIPKNEISTQVLVSRNADKSDAYAIDLEEYVIGVVAGEMPASFHMEALKAQAVASRTFAMNKMKTIQNYVLSTTINDQVYLTIDEMKKNWGSEFQYYYDRVRDAVNATKGEVITNDGSVITSYYFAISNGYTDDATVVFGENKNYLVSVESPWDKNYQSYSSTRTMSRVNFCERLDISCNSIEVGNVVRADTHYVREITINGKNFSGLSIFNKLNLKSTDFEIKILDDTVEITTYGFGHGVGMSQYGAQGMAREGYSYQDILTYYYKNTEITKI